MTHVYLGLGTNLGEREANLQQALKLLTKGKKPALSAVNVISKVYETVALLPDGAPREWDMSYYNIVISAETDLTPQELLLATQAVQTQMGRKDVGHWGPRIIDIDLLDMEGAVIDEAGLQLPHPEMLNRDFVMLPLLEVSPDWKHPNGETARDVVHAAGFKPGGNLKRLMVDLAAD